MLFPLSNGKWIWEWERQMPPFIWWHIGSVYIKDRTLLPYSTATLFAFRKGAADMYLHKSFNQNARYFFRAIKSGSGFMNRYRTEMKREEGEIVKFGKQLLKINFSSLSIIKLCDLIAEYSQLYRQHGVGVIRIFNHIGTDALIDYLKVCIPHEKISEYVSVLTEPINKSAFTQEYENLQHIASLIKRRRFWRRIFSTHAPTKIIKELEKFPIVKKRIDLHLAHYQHLVCGYADEQPQMIIDIIKAIQDILNKPRRSRARSGLSRKVLMQYLTLTHAVERLSNALSEFTYYKDSIRSYYNFLHYSSRGLFEECARRLGITLAELRMFTPDEIIKALKRGVVDKKLIRARSRLCVIYAQGGKLRILGGRQAQEFLNKELGHSNIESTSKIRGMCAQAGHIVGKVKIVKKPSDFSARDHSFILVTPMTTPELMPAAKQALAIVTDEGGITCHAAIVAREMHKPCVIGTKIASKILKDGDLVEVDATHGIVKVKN